MDQNLFYFYHLYGFNIHFKSDLNNKSFIGTDIKILHKTSFLLRDQ
jgi:hypothetical protein